MSSQCASIYKLPTHFIVCPVSKTTAGVYIASEPYQVLPDLISPIEMGEAICRALQDSQEKIAHPIDWKALAVPRLAAAGVKTESSFQKKSKLVSAEFDGVVLTITPHRNGGAAGDGKGFHEIIELAAHVGEMSSDSVGSASLLAFERCT